MLLNFMAPSLNIVNLEPCQLERMDHHQKMFLYMLVELMFIYRGLGDDYDDQQIIAFKMLNLAWRHYCHHKHSCQAKSTVRGDAMHCICHGDYLGLERLAWAVYDGILAVGPTPTLSDGHVWDRIAQGISLCLIY